MNRKLNLALWIVAGILAVVLLVASSTSRGTVLAEVLIVVVAFGWFFLTAWLQRHA
ncbi:MAG TPA: hypothetical protein VEC76_04495 [Streptosporangiaceae bacterium]|nr:hypothetical protein [Streptosporangiaceae bacterium]